MTFGVTPVLAAAGGGNGHDIPAFLLTLAAILVGAKLFGELAERIGQPAVLGELVAGVLLGSSALGVIPAAGPIAEVITILAELGVLILLFEIGLETDLREMRRVGELRGGRGRGGGRPAVPGGLPLLVQRAARHGRPDDRSRPRRSSSAPRSPPRRSASRPACSPTSRSSAPRKGASSSAPP